MIFAVALDFFRWHISLDIDDMIALLSAVTALVAVFAWKRTYNKQRTVTETVDAPVLAEFLRLTEKVADVEHALHEANRKIDELTAKVTKYARDEAVYQAELHSKNEQIANLTDKLATAREERAALKVRVEHLEEVCKRAGINGEEG